MYANSWYRIHSYYIRSEHNHKSQISEWTQPYEYGYDHPLYKHGHSLTLTTWHTYTPADQIAIHIHSQPHHCTTIIHFIFMIHTDYKTLTTVIAIVVGNFKYRHQSIYTLHRPSFDSTAEMQYHSHFQPIEIQRQNQPPPFYCKTKM